MGPSMAGARDPAWPPPPCARCGRAQSSWARIIIYKDKQYLCTDCREANIVHLTWRVVLSGLPRNSPVLAVVDSILLFLESPTRLERIRYLHQLLQALHIRIHPSTTSIASTTMCCTSKFTAGSLARMRPTR